MIDINLLRENSKAVAKLLKERGFDLDINKYESLEKDRKVIQVKTQELQGQRNQFSKNIGIAKGKGNDASDLMEQVNIIAETLKELENQLSIIQASLNQFLLNIPNIPHDSVPNGSSEKDNLIVKESGKPQNFTFEIKDHVDVGLNHGLDFELGSKLSGARFVSMKGGMAKLHRAIGQMMLDVQTQEHGYEECYTPYLVNEESLIGTGQLPKFSEDLFKTSKGDDDSLYLIPTGEVPLTNFVRDTIIEESDLPLKFTAHTPCFRSEAGSYGKDTRGMIRQHQFDKVEMVQISHADASYKVLDEMVVHAENILQKLELPYRVVSLCKGDMGFGAAKTFDIEVWLPSQNTYREISSISNCEDFQARRLKARYKNLDGKNAFVHTLNGSGLAVGRTLVAILENYQQENGDIIIPKALVSYMGGKKTLTSK
ncbi:serine--tRNA ligase [Methylophilaceae bacterium]|jgi:seryl-tRNA synthetase|nr:serine--tRNA ligase [Methylophilaceae bacterium]